MYRVTAGSGPRHGNIDGILLKGSTLWAVQNLNNQAIGIRLGSGLESGDVGQLITSPRFDVPSPTAPFGETLAVVNATFTSPAAAAFEVVRVCAR
jgi:hypothetical protein